MAVGRAAGAVVLPPCPRHPWLTPPALFASSQCPHAQLRRSDTFYAPATREGGIELMSISFSDIGCTAWQDNLNIPLRLIATETCSVTAAK